MEEVVDGGVVAEAVSLTDTTDRVVLLDPERRPPAVLSWHPFHNIVRVTASGEVQWRADLVPGESTAKCWIGLSYDGDALKAWTYCYECVLDPKTGLIIESTFTK